MAQYLNDFKCFYKARNWGWHNRDSARTLTAQLTEDTEEAVINDTALRVIHLHDVVDNGAQTHDRG